jgi:hypothetical protein
VTGIASALHRNEDRFWRLPMWGEHVTERRPVRRQVAGDHAVPALVSFPPFLSALTDRLEAGSDRGRRGLESNSDPFP